MIGLERENVSVPIPIPDNTWISNNDLARELGKNGPNIRTVARKYSKDHAEWFGKRETELRNGARKIVEVYSPELAFIIREKYTKGTEAPQDWKTNNTLSLLLNIDYKYIGSLANKYRETHPEWFRRFWMRGFRREEEYFAPELIEELTKQVNAKLSLSSPPQGWMTVHSLMIDFREKGEKRSVKYIEKRIEKFKKSDPDSVREYLSPKRMVLEYLSPNLVRAIQNESENIGSAPNGWKTAEGLAKCLKEQGIAVTSRTVRTLFLHLMTKHREWFGQFNRRGGTFSYCSPEAVAEITKELKVRNRHRRRRYLEVNLVTQNNEEPGRINPRTKIYTDSQGKNWVLREYLSKSFLVPYEKLNEILTNIPSLVGRSSANQSILLFDEAEAEKILKEHGFERPTETTVVINKNTRQFTDKEGNLWLNLRDLAGRLKTPRSTAKHFLKNNNIPYVEARGTQGGKTALYNLNEAVREYQKIKKIPKLSEGWMTISGFAEKLKRSQIVSNTVNKYRHTHPEWFAKRRSHWKIVEAISPELIKIATEEILGKNAPEGWHTYEDFARITKISEPTLRVRARPYKVSNPEWFGIFVSNRRKKAHLSPVLIEEIKKQAKSLGFEVRPLGWETINNLSEKFQKEGLKGFSNKSLEDRIKIYAKTHPEWFGEYLNPRSHIPSQYLSPELVLLIKKDLEVGTPPRGWYNAFRLAEKIAGKNSKRLGVIYQRMTSLIETFKREHPEWFKEYIAKGGMITHISPEGVMEITKILNEREKQEGSYEKAPQGWLTTNSLMRKLNEEETLVSYDKIRRIADQVQNSNPEWFKNFIAINGVTQHFSPQACEQIIKIINGTDVSSERANEYAQGLVS